MTSRITILSALVLMVGVAAPALAAQAPQGAAPPARGGGAGPAGGGLTGARESSLFQEHPGYPGALAPANLAKPRPKPPFDFTGTWFVNLRRSFNDFRFGPPYPEFFEPGQTAMKEAAEARAAGKPYRDSIGQCYPAGMPMIMTRVWPFNAIQLPTVMYQLFGFTSSMRFIYLDGRKFTDPDIAVYTYNGESIGTWEKDALVVHTKYLEPNEHYIDSGIPISDQFEIIERYTLEENGESMRIDYTMTDPKMWKGEWKSTKRFIRLHEGDIPEAECLPALNENMPSTEAGQRAIEERARK